MGSRQTREVPPKTRIFILHGQALIRGVLREFLDGCAGFVVVGEAGAGPKAPALIRRARPDVVLVDLNGLGPQGIDTITAIRESAPNARVVALVSAEARETGLSALCRGASGVVPKSATPARLERALRRVHAGQSISFRGKDHGSIARTGGEGAGLDGEELTPRETEVLGHLAGGHTNKEIAGLLGISVRTVETHRENLMRKLNIHNLAGLTRYAIYKGIHVLD